MFLTKYGKRECRRLTVAAVPLILLCIAGGVLVNAAGYAFAVLFFFAFVAGLSFFRDPERKIPEDETLILSPADGVVHDIELIPAADSGHLASVFKGQDMLRIGIDVSAFDVRVNRAPYNFTVKFRERIELDRSAKVAVILAGTAFAGDQEITMGIKQISNPGQNNIVCEPVPGAELVRGERYGMIRFGSRLELFLPAKSDLLGIQVEIGDRVQAGLTTIVKISQNSKKEDKS